MVWQYTNKGVNEQMNNLDKERTIPLDRYLEDGFNSRSEYINYLKSEYGALHVNALLTVLPPSEDFDGLITELEDNKSLFFWMFP